jgi:N-3-fumaroyl-(S)-2,3-diaminopropanoate amidotransferase
MSKQNDPILIFDNTEIKVETSSYYHLFDNLYSKYPFTEVGKIKILFYGVLYNKTQLMEKYNIKFTDESEIIGVLFNTFGNQFSDLVDGAFCAVIIQNKTIIMFRDYFGLETLYYSVTNHRNIVISNRIDSIKSLLKLEINSSFLAHYFLYDDHTNWETIYKNIFLVPVYEIVQYNKDKNKFDFEFIGNSPFNASQELKSRTSIIQNDIEQLLENRIYDLLDPKFSIVNMLSGGVDSSYIAAVLKKRGFINSISASFDQVGGDEEYARSVADHLKLNYKNISINGDNFFEGICATLSLSKVPYAYKGESFFFNLFKNISDSNRNNCILVNGTGADGIFSCGKELKILRIIGLLPNLAGLYNKLNPNINNLPSVLLRDKNEDYFSKELLYLHMDINDAKLNEVKKILGLTTLPDLFARELNLINQSSSNIADKFSRFHAYYSQIRIPNVLTAIAKNFNIRIVYPFLSKDLFRYVLSLPMSERVTFTSKKYHLRKLLSKYLPQKIINRKKLNMEVPFIKLFQNNERFKLLIEDIKDAKYDFLDVDYKQIFSSPAKISWALKLINIHLINEKIIKG